jgi:hypothetical protein
VLCSGLERRFAHPSVLHLLGLASFAPTCSAGAAKVVLGLNTGSTLHALVSCYARDTKRIAGLAPEGASAVSLQLESSRLLVFSSSRLLVFSSSRLLVFSSSLGCLLGRYGSVICEWFISPCAPLLPSAFLLT